MDDVEAERQRLEAELIQLGMNPGILTPARVAARNRRIDELQQALAKLPPRRTTLHSRPRLPPGWTRDREEEGGHVVDYDPWARFYGDGE